MAPKSVMKKKQMKNKKPAKASKVVSKKVEVMSDGNDDSDDGSLDAIEFNSE